MHKDRNLNDDLLDLNDSWKMTHSSIMPMTLGDTQMYVYCGSGGVVGVMPNNGIHSAIFGGQIVR